MRKTLTLIILNVGLLMIAYGLVLTFWQQYVNINPVSSNLLIPELPDPQILLRDSLKPPNSLPVLLPVAKTLPDYMGLDDQIWGENQQAGDQIALLKSIDNSLRYLSSAKSISDYQKYRIPGITRDRVIRSLTRFRQLVRTSRDAAQLWSMVQKEFVLYQSIGRDGLGNVLFTAYYEPVYDASRTPTAEYRYPIYRLPPNFKSWAKPHPTRQQLEGKDGLQASKGKLKGLELFWLRDRLEAYFIQIQGSAKLRLTDGTITTVGYAGNTAYNYSSIGKALADDEKLPLENLTMPVILQYFHQNPQELDNYLPRDRSFVFFQENYGHPATGSLSVPLTAERSIATDKSIMPPGALALIYAPFPYADGNQKMQFNTVSRYVLDQDTGGAIKGAGRVDYFVGTGKLAGEKAGMTKNMGTSPVLAGRL
ncbi:murein transglycosylase A [Phormidium sp. LEGE 05292]|uniref:murein transglycosylase A n=1 Tax=[Phormidium] sp. LEGE 05292 TaxID=767427 RepID=UPI001880BECF|nr:murein transglycosylase A [Phormidium sp. LEGE 05292]MBE9227582.1 murein transglycosylase A [Phormidium sp. LEGE 05292]